MTRIKRLGFGLAAVSMLCAVVGVASAAAANGFLAEQYPATFAATAEKGSNFEALGTSCEYLPSLAQGSMEQEAHPTTRTEMPAAGLPFQPCGAPVLMNGCKFTFNVGRGTWGIGPAGCGPIKIEFKTCPGYVYPKEGQPATYSNLTKEKAHASVSGTFKMTYCGSEYSITYNLNWAVSATNALGFGDNVQVASIPGVYVTGADGETVKFESGSAAEITDNGAQPSSFKFAGGTINCTTTHYKHGVIKDEGGFHFLDVDPEYSGCSTAMNGGPEGVATTGVVPSGCEYLYVLSEGGPPYLAKLWNSCSIEYSIYNGPGGTLGCTVKLGTTFFSTEKFSAENVYTTKSAVKLSAKLNKFPYKLVGSACGSAEGSYTTGVLTGTTSLWN
jgi:hypothetical protein